ncbi:allantoicase [Haloechinothrix sp. LS1_15]|uniref:allantoicase n=1 Tax=Haloechinothrix sp. LS1_15 TaxID=2652248 RepID=UPI0029484BF5|nr:allantoicase [Haloechinothrix sp. LS1_15]MDV6012835.1 allantoicase [Haloechinothrix sp. LS1_15]
MRNVDFDALPDLASRALGGAVVTASDEFFAEKENLLNPEPPVFQPHTFGHKGQIYDGWETRRRRDQGYDWAIVRLGVPGVIHGVTVDTAHFTGNYPEYCSIEAASVAGYPSPEELLDEPVEWVEIVPRAELKGDSANQFPVRLDQRFTHVRLNIIPDGGVARLRVHGEVVTDPRWFTGLPLDLAAQANGGVVTDCSNRFFSSPNNLLMPGNARVMGEGWETARRRGGGNDWVSVRLAEEGIVRQVEIDTTHFKGNAPGWFRLTGGTDPDDEGGWIELVERTTLQPDTCHRFLVSASAPVRHVKVDVYPDGGFARLRIYGELTASGRERIGLDWYNRLPASRAEAVLTEEAGVTAEAAASIASARPLAGTGSVQEAISAAGLPPETTRAVRSLLLGAQAG